MGKSKKLQIGKATDLETIDNIILGTAIIQIMDTRQSAISFRALLDNGSQVNLITKAAIQQLNIKIQPERTTFLGLGGNNLGSSCGEVALTIKLRDGNYIRDKFHVVKSITSYCPHPNHLNWDRINSELADKDYNQPGKINALLGVGIWIKIIEPEIIKTKDSLAIAQRTKLGYVIFENQHNPYDAEKPYIGSISKGASVRKLMEIIQKLWEVEEIPQQRKRSREEEICEQIFKNQHSRDKFGRYIVRIPFDSQIKLLGKSKKMALRQFFAMESRMKKNEEFATKYKLFMSNMKP